MMKRSCGKTVIYRLDDSASSVAHLSVCVSSSGSCGGDESVLVFFLSLLVCVAGGRPLF